MEEKLSRKDLYQELWKGRDLELTSLWQRSIFLMSFLVIAFTAYCGLWVVFFSKEDSSIHELLLMNLGFVCISVFGLVASVLWIMMSKGSKYWYEKYEGSISRIIEDRELDSDELANTDRQTESNNGDSVLLMNTIFTEYFVLKINMFIRFIPVFKAMSGKTAAWNFLCSPQTVPVILILSLIAAALFWRRM